ncbi:acyl transferase/acyl hydrolase/lysophospholipase [Globomyces pollinis-pini]|nr:acyl transferase/acyl hydrolase/lysophospholipase [Globomyces pollinis-pini]
MIFNLRTSLCRNLGDMGNPRLYEKTHVGTKALIEDYIDEVTKQINFICDVDIPGFGINDKLEFLKNTQKAFGRTALLLSGGGTFGLCHVGTVKALWEQKLLPRVLTGSSSGSIVAGVVGTKTDKELPLIFDAKIINYNFFERPHEISNWFIKISRLLKAGVLMDVEVFNECMINNIGDITFAEAFRKTRRILNITVSSSTDFEMQRILNYLTAPNVLVRSAVAASCAVPFVFRPATLLAKNAHKEIVPWNPSGHKWIDGSVEGDLPMQRISEHFGINHYCVSQTNPYIIPFLNVSGQRSTPISRAIVSTASILGSEIQHRLQQLIDLGMTNTLLFKVKSMICQKYVGDITIVPHIMWSKFPLVMANPDLSMAKYYSNSGESATWPQIALLRNHCLIEQCISANIISLRGKLVVNHNSDFHNSASNITYLPILVKDSPIEAELLKMKSLEYLPKPSANIDPLISVGTAGKTSNLQPLYRSEGNLRKSQTLSFTKEPPQIKNPMNDRKSILSSDPLQYIDLKFDDSDSDI